MRTIRCQVTRVAFLLALTLAPFAARSSAAPGPVSAAPPSSASPLALDGLSGSYPATRSHSPTGLRPICNAEDVWRLKSFEVAQGKDLVLRCKKATVAFGHDGTDVLWAVVLPDAPVKITGSLVETGESAQSILLRFGPSEIDRVFPAKTVEGRGDAWRRFEAVRIARRKMVWRWCTPAGHPTIVPASVVIVDVDTVGGPRRFWALDRNAGKVVVVDDFEDQPTPPAAPIDARAAEAAFDEVWDAFDRGYPGFAELSDLDWNKAGRDAKRLLKRVETTHDLAAVLSELLAQLEDLHVWVKAGDDWLHGYSRERPFNGNWNATRAELEEPHQAGNQFVWGVTHDGLGYLGIHGLGDRQLADKVDAALESLKDTPGMIVDLRFNGGGDEVLARRVAGRFLDEARVYGWNRYRSGPKHEDLGPVLERRFEPRGPWRYDKPVVCLWGRGTLSSAESMAKMFAVCPNVTTMGAPSGGSSGNPRQIQLDCGITVNQPRWLDLLEDGTALERRGLAPEVLLDHGPDAFGDRSDPVIRAAIDRLTRD